MQKKGASKTSEVQNRKGKASTPTSKAKSTDSSDDKQMWGRMHKVTWIDTISVTFLLIVSFVGTNYVWSSCTHFQCEALGPANYLFKAPNLWEALFSIGPKFSWEATQLYVGWVVA